MDKQIDDILISNDECVKLINATPQLMSLLHDLNLMPEQVDENSKEWCFMAAFCYIWQAARAALEMTTESDAKSVAAKMPCGTSVSNVYEAYEAGKQAALAQQEPAIPDGWQLVPIEPTEEMMTGAFDDISLSDAHSNFGVQEHVWSYMLNAAPKFKKDE